jgi:hypothetical protein
MFANKKLPKNTNEHKYIYIVIVCYNVTMNKLFVVGVLIMLVYVVAICIIHIVEDKTNLDLDDRVYSGYHERVELYYNIDDNTKAYTKSEDGSFEEAILNGNS